MIDDRLYFTSSAAYHSVEFAFVHGIVQHSNFNMMNVDVQCGTPFPEQLTLKR